MNEHTDANAAFQLPGTSIALKRMGYGAMQLAGPGVWGPPRDPNAAVALLREAVASGVNHIDTSDFYGPHVTNQIIRQALHPYPDGLVYRDQGGRATALLRARMPSRGRLVIALSGCKRPMTASSRCQNLIP
jgi:predicted aldo/keto reductase-like oxidoreductase